MSGVGTTDHDVPSQCSARGLGPGLAGCFCAPTDQQSVALTQVTFHRMDACVPVGPAGDPSTHAVPFQCWINRTGWALLSLRLGMLAPTAQQFQALVHVVPSSRSLTCAPLLALVMMFQPGEREAWAVGIDKAATDRTATTPMLPRPS